MAGEAPSQPKWYLNGVNWSSLYMMLLICIAAVIIFSFWFIVEFGVVWAILGIVMASIFIGWTFYHTWSIETVVKPIAVSVRPEGIIFRKKDGSERLYRWDEIRELTVNTQEVGPKNVGVVKLYDYRYPIPIPYEAFEDAIIERRKATSNQQP